ncbi:MAG: diadenylate cyclase CdaA [Firmicutes bacterium]|nr:diadenylate cyclase CdaA [Bacillota bacterium]
MTFPFSFPFVSLISIIDIILVAFVLYKLMMLIKGTRAVQLLKGLAVLLMAATISKWAGFYTINWMLEKTVTMVFVALPVVFQPELRRALEQIGRGKFFVRPITILGVEATSQLINEIVRTVQVLTKNKMGALIILERETGINDYIETGTKLDGIVSAEFLINIFIPKSPLHDGAAIIRGDRVAAAGCFLPLSENPDLSQDIGTRHRAALGITELSDCLAIVVSEETGIIPLAMEGTLTRYLDEKTLKEMLNNLLQPENTPGSGLWQWRVNK